MLIFQILLVGRIFKNPKKYDQIFQAFSTKYDFVQDCHHRIYFTESYRTPRCYAAYAKRLTIPFAYCIKYVKSRHSRQAPFAEEA